MSTVMVKDDLNELEYLLKNNPDSRVSNKEALRLVSDIREQREKMSEAIKLARSFDRTDSQCLARQIWEILEDKP